MPHASRQRAIVLVAAFAAIGLALRLIMAHQSLFADEIATYWVVTAHSLPGVVSTVHTDAEITPPLFFVLSWATTVFGDSPVLVRGPSLIAGVALIPLMYALGRRTIGSAGALAAAAFTALAPYAIYYSSEARAYAVMMALVVASTIALLNAIDSRQRRWWVLYAVCSAGAMYSHYTCAFLLATQAVWALIRYPPARRAVLLANGAAALAFAPWITGLLADFDSPTTKILDALTPFTGAAVREAFERWALGYPGVVAVKAVGLATFPGVVALVALAAGLLLGATGLRRVSLRAVLESRVTLVVALALSLPVGETIASAAGTNLLGTRNLAASWPAFVLVLAALATAAPRRLRLPAAALVAVSFAIGAVQLPTGDYERPDVRSAAGFVEREAAPGALVIDATGVLSPGPLTSLDTALAARYRVVRAVAPAERDHPFNVLDTIVPLPEAIRYSVATAKGEPVYLVSTLLPEIADPVVGARIRRQAAADERFPASYRLAQRHVYEGILDTVVRVYVRRAST